MPVLLLHAASDFLNAFLNTRLVECRPPHCQMFFVIENLAIVSLTIYSQRLSCLWTQQLTNANECASIELTFIFVYTLTDIGKQCFVGP